MLDQHYLCEHEEEAGEADKNLNACSYFLSFGRSACQQAMDAAVV